MMLIRQIMKGEYSMEGPEWVEVTSETKDLVKIYPLGGLLIFMTFQTMY